MERSEHLIEPDRSSSRHGPGIVQRRLSKPEEAGSRADSAHLEPIQGEARRGRIASGLLLILFVSACVGPRLPRLSHPSLQVDDLHLIASVSTEGGLAHHLLLPHNDHVLPLFRCLTWLLWNLSGQELEQTPLVFSIAGFVPFLASVFLIRSVVRRDLRSESAALAAVAIFCLSSWVFDETVYWYAATSFMWCLAATLLAWRCVAMALVGGNRVLWIGAVVVAMASPFLLLVGLLTGPIATLRGLSQTMSRSFGWRHRLLSLSPMLGTLLYLVIVQSVQGEHARQSAGKRLPLLLDFEVVQSIVRAPFEVLLPAMAGLYRHVSLPNIFGAENVRELPWPLVLASTMIGLIGVVIWSLRSRYRAFILTALGMIYSGYVLTLTFDFPGPYQYRIAIERYHLFPHLGMVFLISVAFLPLLRRFDRVHPVGRLLAANALALGLILSHESISERSRTHYEAPDQVGTLAALDRLSQICEEEGITRHQAIAAFDPVSRKTWFPHDPLGVHNLLILARSPVDEPLRPDAEVRSVLLGRLSVEEVEAICGGSDLTSHVTDRVENGGQRALEATPGIAYLVEDLGAGRVSAGGWNPARRSPPFLEYLLPALDRGARPRFLDIPGSFASEDHPGARLELWWSGVEGDWNVYRSVHWKPRSTDVGWRLPIDRMPHWDSSQVRRIRILLRDPIVLELGPPRLVP